MKMKVTTEIQDKYIYKSLDVTLLLAAKANQRKMVVNHTKIQKLLFITYGSYLAVYGKRLVDEHPQCWPYGPVFPKLREENLMEDFSSIELSDRRLSKIKTNKTLSDLIDFVLKRFGAWSTGDLTSWCMDSIPCKSTPDDGHLIDDQIIIKFFNSLIKK